MFFDLHVHTRISPCSVLSLAEILTHAAAKGLDGVCITDHESLQAREQVREGVQADGLRVFVGMEYSTPEGDFLLFGPLQHLPPGLAATELLQFVDRIGGAAVAAHPFRKHRAVSEAVIRAKLCRVVESINGRNSDGENRQVKEWTRRYPLIACGGSDAHSLSELGKIQTRFDMPINSTADLVYALNNGLCTPYRSTGAGRALAQPVPSCISQSARI